MFSLDQMLPTTEGFYVQVRDKRRPKGKQLLEERFHTRNEKAAQGRYEEWLKKYAYDPEIKVTTGQCIY